MRKKALAEQEQCPYTGISRWLILAKFRENLRAAKIRERTCFRRKSRTSLQLEWVKITSGGKGKKKTEKVTITHGHEKYADRGQEAAMKTYAIWQQNYKLKEGRPQQRVGRHVTEATFKKHHYKQRLRKRVMLAIEDGRPHHDEQPAPFQAPLSQGSDPNPHRRRNRKRGRGGKPKV